MRNVEVFDVAPTKVCIPSHSHIFAVVTFAPQSMQSYQAVFEASLEGATRCVCVWRVCAVCVSAGCVCVGCVSVCVWGSVCVCVCVRTLPTCCTSIFVPMGLFRIFITC